MTPARFRRLLRYWSTRSTEEKQDLMKRAVALAAPTKAPAQVARMETSEKVTLFEPPTFMHGLSVARAVELSDGGARIESWVDRTGTWREGGASWCEFMLGRALTRAELEDRGITS